MDTIHNHEVITAPGNSPVEYEFLDSYEGYDNPDLLADLRVSMIEATRGKNKKEARRVRTKLIKRYLNNRLDTDGLTADETDAEYDLAYDDVRYWTSISLEDWEGDKDPDGNYLGNGLYDELALDIRDWQVNGDPEEVAVASLVEQLRNVETGVLSAREAYAARLAKASGGIRNAFKNVENDDELIASEAAWRQSLVDFARAYTEKAMTEKPADASEAAWREVIKMQLLQGMTAEFRQLELSKVAKIEDSRMNKIVGWFNKGGKLKRVGKGILVGLGVGLATLPLGAAAGVIGAGGIVAGGAFGLTRFAKGFAGWQGRSPSARDLGTTDAGEYDRELEANVYRSGDYSTIDHEEAVARAAAIAAGKEMNRTAETKKSLRRSLYVGAAAVGAGAAVTGLVHFADGKLGIRDWVSEKLGLKDDVKTVASVEEPDTPVDHDSVIPEAPTEPLVEPPAQPPVDEVIPVVLPVPSAEDFRMLGEFLNAEGQYPWSRAVDVFGGDEQAATNWILQSADQAGATWHNPGTVDAWIEIDGRSDTDYVWNKLVEASLRNLGPQLPASQ